MKATIGIEVHVELKSKAKVFSNSKNNFNDDANTNISLIDYGYPGTLPQLNKKIIDLALKTSLAFNCKINRTMNFDRKNYFYPDLPKGYQITQKDTPIGYDGFIKISNKNIEIERIHIEEDTCKSIHTTATLLNFNRAGVPLIEIVTKPCIENGDEAIEYLEKLRQTLLYLGVSDVKIEEGSMRCDVNVSVSNTDKLGTKCEVKNIGSISSAKIAIDYEIKRQTELLNKNETIKEQTRRFDEKTKQTVLMREKETGNDYRYFKEPDLPLVYIDDEWLENTKKQVTLLPDELKDTLKNLGLNQNHIKTLIDNIKLCHVFNSLKDECNPVIAANLLTGDVLAYLNKNLIKIEESLFSKENFIILVNSLDNKEITSNDKKDLIEKLFIENYNIKEDIKTIKNNSLSNEEVDNIINNIVNNNPESIKDYKEGKDKATKFLMGQIMKETKGKANPIYTNQKLIETLNNALN